MKQLGLRDLFWDNYSYSWIKDIENYLDEDLDDELNTIIYIELNELMNDDLCGNLIDNLIKL
jgi:hypothetical protein